VSEYVGGKFLVVTTIMAGELVTQIALCPDEVMDLPPVMRGRNQEGLEARLRRAGPLASSNGGI
jgi:hypothetical protein